MPRSYLRIAAVIGLAALGLAALLVAPTGAAPADGAPTLVGNSSHDARVSSTAASTPTLSAQPGAITFTAHISFPAILTRTIQIYNVNPGAPLTWTAAVDPSGAVQPLVSPISGVNTATLTVQIATLPFTFTGAYTGAIGISAEPTTTLGSPITIGVSLVLTDRFNGVYMPLVGKNYNPATPPPPLITTTRFGLNFISSAEARAAEIRYQRAAGVRAAINRWPFYWNRIEQNPLTQPGVFSWAWQDENTINDVNHGLTIDAILIGTPVQFGGARASANSKYPQVGQGWKLQAGELSSPSIAGMNGTPADPPPGLNLSVFGDGTDIPGPGKSINPDNRWARFVYAAVNRYKPGGVLAQQQGWSDGQGIRVWEVWNEPDLGLFFNGTPTDYARLLKVAFLAARHADPHAHILFGGLANFEKPNWLHDTLSVIDTYPDRYANEWFFDSVAVHNYAWAWRTFYDLFRARVKLDAFGLTDKTLWLNETGVPVCDDPPGPSCADPANRTFRAAPQEQAAFVIQAATFAVWLKTEAMLVFQLYDDFGNVCPGIDAFGLVRNVPDAPCNPGDGAPRPAYIAYQVVTRYFSGVSPYWRRRPTVDQELVALRNPETGERVIAMWARDYFTETAVITATADSAVLVYPDGVTETITPVNGVYTITLPMATNTNTPTTDGKAPIGGMPRMLIEFDPGSAIIP